MSTIKKIIIFRINKIRNQIKSCGKHIRNYIKDTFSMWRGSIENQCVICKCVVQESVARVSHIITKQSLIFCPFPFAARQPDIEACPKMKLITVNFSWSKRTSFILYIDLDQSRTKISHTSNCRG